MGLYVKVAHRDATGNYFLGDEPIVETVHETVGDIFRAAAGRDRTRRWEAMGRCTGKVYVDGPDGKPQQVGWVFVQRKPYEDDPKQTYLHEAWITVHTAPDTVVRTSHFADFPR